MKIKFLDLYGQSKEIRKKILYSIKKNIKNSNFINGEDVQKFEKKFAKYLSIKFCLGVANGTDALEIAIKSLNLPKNSEFIVPANTWISTAESVLNTGNKLKFVDCDNTHNICIKDLSKKITRNTKAIIVVHLFGNPANILKIKKICKKKNIKLIEDCAQAHGAAVNKKKISTFGDVSTFSFFPSKNLGCFGDGGAIVTNNKKIYLNCKKIANHGGLKKNEHTVLGRNSRLDTIQASILLIKLTKLKKWLKIRKAQSDFYKKNLVTVGDIELVKQNKNTEQSNHLFVIRTKKRDKLRKFLEKKNIQTGIHYPKTLPELKIFKKDHMSYCRRMNSILYKKKILSLPIGEHLKINHLKYVSRNITKFFKNEKIS